METEEEERARLLPIIVLIFAFFVLLAIGGVIDGL